MDSKKLDIRYTSATAHSTKLRLRFHNKSILCKMLIKCKNSSDISKLHTCKIRAVCKTDIFACIERACINKIYHTF